MVGSFADVFECYFYLSMASNLARSTNFEEADAMAFDWHVRLVAMAYGRLVRLYYLRWPWNWLVRDCVVAMASIWRVC